MITRIVELVFSPVVFVMIAVILLFDLAYSYVYTDEPPRNYFSCVGTGVTVYVFFFLGGDVIGVFGTETLNEWLHVNRIMFGGGILSIVFLQLSEVSLWQKLYLLVAPEKSGVGKSVPLSMAIFDSRFAIRYLSDLISEESNHYLYSNTGEFVFCIRASTRDSTIVLLTGVDEEAVHSRSRHKKWCPKCNEFMPYLSWDTLSLWYTGTNRINSILDRSEVSPLVCRSCIEEAIASAEQFGLDPKVRSEIVVQEI